MITSLFTKSKPINFIIVFFITVLAFLTARAETEISLITTGYIFKQVVIFLICIGTVLVYNFIITKNSFTKNGYYEILIFSLFFLTFVQTTNNTNILLSNFFVLLGVRRIISLRSQRSVKKKLFDAALWIGFASLFYFWAILFFVVIILSLILYTDNNLRHWILPFLGTGAVFVIAMSISIVAYDDFFELFNASRGVSYDFTVYNSTHYLVAITMILSFGIWSSIFYLQNIKHKKKDSRASFKIIIIAAIIAFLIVIQAPRKSGSEFLFLFAPLSIIITNYIEIIKDNWFREVFVSILICIPFLLLVL
jgi:hypothetical protein